MGLISKTPSALNVEIQGTLGSFSISKKDQPSSCIEVNYLLTHVSLDTSQAKLLDMLAPVREVFDIDQLSFEEIMQRDIDDARVSMDLIPYLLDHRSSGLVKLFPPIVVVVLPLQELNRKPAQRYADIVRDEKPEDTDASFTWERITAGPLGKEQFSLKRLRRPDGTYDTAHSSLSVSDMNCALAIVDGQHRAMALLALYRNMTSAWSDAKRAAYEQYYRVWSGDEIRSYELKDLQMPMIICTFPQLDSTYPAEMDVIRAARRVFLDLNKNAKKVSDSRNKLLDDQDMVSECLRIVLASIKKYNINTTSSLRIWNVELDQAQDRSVISSPVAITGVSHLYYITEHILFYQERNADTGARKGRPARARRLGDAYTRLGLLNDLTVTEREENSRQNYTDQVARVVEKRWEERYGRVIEKIFSDFHPFKAHCEGSLSISERLKSVNLTKLWALIFDGQASARTFIDFKDRLDLKVDSDPTWDTGELRAIKKDVHAHINEYEAEIERFKRARAVAFLANVKGPGSKSLLPAQGEVVNKAAEITTEIYQTVFSTIAFQAAVVLTLVEAYEHVYDASAGDIHSITDDEVSAYVDALHKLFRPVSFDSFAHLAGVFKGEIAAIEGDISLTQSASTFGKFIMSGEMQPEEWPKYRYLILELWEPTDERLAKMVKGDLNVCRTAVMKSAFKRSLTDFCNEHVIAEQNVTSEQRETVLNGVKGTYEKFLGNVRRKQTDLRSVADGLKGQLGVLSATDSQQAAG
ncbi:DNA sulfur modification protein DndB [Dyella sp. GSA-30]|uniref:DNA sulfur modification protein DndB n=1 Tax=Dyella sp. GSA-30 TaxID=2994496 RepID=UPI00249327D0|nr:DNA sulfur modification protein DndB [Dyella sp. GSA-30]BDU22918.1 hypothetical protein DYGSA30_43750 [Dyella sp. GSA-30]